MELLKVIDNSLDDREFRNIIYNLLLYKKYREYRIDDTRICDDDPKNNNDLYAENDFTSFTIQTYLNKNITRKEVDETIVDMVNEKSERGIIVTNKNTSNEINEYANENNIIIWDRDILEKILR